MDVFLRVIDVCRYRFKRFLAILASCNCSAAHYKDVPMTPARAHLFIRGRVQGVFYRAFTRGVADELGLNGWVRNLFDGRVEALFEGDRQKVEEAIQRCSKGPPGAKVDDVEMRWEEYQGESKDFNIR